MKLLKYNIVFLLLTVVFLTACEKDFVNINKPAEDLVLTSKEGLLAASIGMTQHFATSTLAAVVEIPALTTRELGNLSTFLTPTELVAGGTALPEDNAGTTRLWSRLLRDKGVAESILANVDAVTMEAGTKSGLKAYAKFFKAMTLGYLIQSFEQAPIDNQADGQAVFSDRVAVLAECINLLGEAKALITTTPMSDEFLGTMPNMDLPNMINAFLARYHLMAGNYNEAITAANAVDLSSKSEWVYDGTANQNPVWNFTVNGEPDTKPQDNFGLLGAYVPEAGDGRIAFYLDPLDEVSVHCGEHLVENMLGFFAAADTSIPVFLPGEILLIKAEAYAMTNLADAIAPLNAVREKTDDIYGINAGLGPWTGDTTDKTAVLNEIYKNRSIELFMTGMRLEDSKRIHHAFVPSNDIDCISERNRNFYPYPYEEKANNSNCPADPAI